VEGRTMECRSAVGALADLGTGPMTTITLAIDDRIKERLDDLARRYGVNQAQLLQEALLEKIEELEDHQLVIERINRPHEVIENRQVWKELDLED
jgi:predicted DNA-binding protein